MNEQFSLELNENQERKLTIAIKMCWNKLPFITAANIL